MFEDVSLSLDLPAIILYPLRFSPTQGYSLLQYTKQYIKKSFINICAAYLIYNVYNNGPLLRESNECRKRALGKLPECVKTGVKVWVL